MRCAAPHHFNPRPPRGGRLGGIYAAPCGVHFNPRPPRGGRPFLMGRSWASGIFQSTPPARGATSAGQLYGHGGGISIHAPREGGDPLMVTISLWVQDFNPRPPRGGRLISRTLEPEIGHFNPRPPRGGRPCGKGRCASHWTYFNPRPPRGGRLSDILLCSIAQRFQSTPPARGATKFV